MNQKVRLLLVSSVFVDRGVERILIFLYRFLPRDTYEIRLLCLRNLSPFADYLNKNTDIRVDVIGMRHNLDIPALFRFYRYIKSFNPHIINFHHFRAALWGGPFARMAGIPVILYSVHNKWGGRVHYLLDRLSARFTDALVPFSIAVKKHLLHVEKIDARYIEEPIYIGIEIDRFNNVSQEECEVLKKELGLNNKQRIIGFVGNVSKQKGLAYLIEAIDIIRKRSGDDICCLIVGDGPEIENFKIKTRELRLQNNFRFLGQRYDTPRLLKTMEIFVLPSLWEGLPQVVIEAMAASCPVIATDVDGTPEIITHMKDGWLVPPADANELATAIERLLKDKPLRDRLSKDGFETVKRRFDINLMVQNYHRLYLNYLQRKT